jgi:hypothetical protein
MMDTVGESATAMATKCMGSHSGGIGQALAESMT